MHDVDVIAEVLARIEGRCARSNVALLRRLQAQLAEAATLAEPQVKDELVAFARDIIASEGNLDIPPMEVSHVGASPVTAGNSRTGT